MASNSLIIMDELGRGTGNEDGIGICHAVCEYLLLNSQVRVGVNHWCENYANVNACMWYSITSTAKQIP